MNEELMSQLKRLPELYSLLAGFQLGPAQRLAVEDLLARLLVNNPNPPDKQAWGQYLAPIVCRTPEQQRQFRHLFESWINPHKTPELEERVVASSPATQIRKSPKWKPAAAAILALVMGVVLVWWAAPFFQKTAPVIKPNTIITTEAPPTRAVTSEQIASDQPHQIIRPIPLGTPQPPSLSQYRERWRMLPLHVLALSLPWLIWLAWLVYRLRDRQVILKNAKTTSANPFDRLTLLLNTGHPFAQAKWMAPLRAAYREPTRRTDAARTLDQTLRKGLLTPVFQSRTRRPLYLVLIDRGSTEDHRASLALALVEQMRSQGVWVEAYEFYRDPHWCYPSIGGSAGMQLPQLLATYPEARLVVTGDASGCFNPITGAAYPVLDCLSSFSYRLWLTTRPAPWGRVEAGLAATGFVVAPLRVEDMEKVTAWLQSPRPGLQPCRAEETSLPLSLRRERDRWLSERPQPQEEVQRLLRDLDRYLGADGFLLLGACATYPQMQGNLAIALDQVLFSQHSADGPSIQAREERLLQLARLPWSQEGTMPVYLRKALLQELKEKRPRIAQAYLTLFSQADFKQKPQGLELPFTANAEQLRQSWQRYLAAWLPHTPRNSALADSLFAQVLLSGRRSLLDFVLPKALAKRLPGIRWGWRRIVLSLAVAALAQVGCVLVWWSIEEPLRQWQLQQMRQAFAEFPVVIQHSATEAANAQLVRRLLAERGFTQVELLPANARQQQNSLGGPSHASEAISILSTLLSSLRYGEPYPQVKSQPNTAAVSSIQIVWVEPVKSLSVFRDPLVKPVSAQRWQAEWEKLQDEINRDNLSNSTEYRVKRVVSEQTGVKLEEISNEASFVEDLGVDELDMAEIKMALEEEFNIEIPDADAEKITTVQLAINYIDGHPSTGVALPNPSDKQILQDTHEKEGVPGPRMVVIPAGEFMMGSPESEPERNDDEGPQHKVILAAFALGETEVTFAEYDRYAKAEGAQLPDDVSWGRGQSPVINVSWEDAIAYSRWLSQQTGAEYRLPTEAEWEYAARAGTSTPFNTGICINSKQANFNASVSYNGCATDEVYLQRPVEVGIYPPNIFGLKDMHGNVAEWVQDCGHASYNGAPKTGTAWVHERGCTTRVLRGGAWAYEATTLRSADRVTTDADVRSGVFGFRLARTLRAEELTQEQGAMAK